MMKFDEIRIARIAKSILAAFKPRYDQKGNLISESGVMDEFVDDNGNIHDVYVTDSFTSSYGSLFSKYQAGNGKSSRGGDSKSTPRQNINDFYRNALLAIKSGNIGVIGDVEIKKLNFANGTSSTRSNGGNTASYFECRPKGHFIKDTSFSPRILFARVPRSNDAILLDIIQKDDNAISHNILDKLPRIYSAIMSMPGGYTSLQKN